MLNIVVCIKQILDPETPSRDFKLDPAGRRAEPGNAALVINPYDENALEVALKLKQAVGDARITALSIGGADTTKALRRAVAMGCDQAVCLSDPLFDDLDSMGIARVLAKGMGKLGTADLVLCGQQAADWDMGQVGYLLAEELSMPCISSVFAMEKTADAIIAHRTIDQRTERWTCPLPAVAIVTNHVTNKPRLPSASGVLAAARKPPAIWSAADVGINSAISRLVTVESLTIPTYDRQVEMIEGDNSQEKAARLVKRMVELKLI